MRGPWFRLYDEVADDPKVQSLPAEDFKGWINLLCIANRNDGRLPSIEAIAFGLRMDVIGARSLVDRLAIGGLIDKVKGGPIGWYIAPHAWDKRQYKSDTSTERVKRFRNATKTVTVTPSEAEAETESERRDSSSSLRSEEEIHALPKPSRKPKAPTKKLEPFNPTLLPLPIFVLWKAIVELRWKDDGVPDHHAREIVEVATWLYEKRDATLEQFKQWVGWWFKSPDSMGSKNGGTRPWPKNVRNTWDTCFASSGGNGAAPVRNVDPDAKAKVEAERARRLAELQATVRSGGAA